MPYRIHLTDEGRRHAGLLALDDVVYDAHGDAFAAVKAALPGACVGATLSTTHVYSSPPSAGRRPPCPACEIRYEGD